MRCPTCGGDTPGTLGKCSNCGAALNEPLGAPVAAPDAAQGLGEGTVLMPPPTPSWASAPAQDSGPMGAPPPAQGTGPLNGAPVDPESTAAWVFEPDADDEPPRPSASATPGSADATQIAPPPAWAAQPHAGTPGSESIVPDSWYAKPRKPEPEPEPDPPTWNPEPAGRPGWDAAPAAAATQMDWNAQSAQPAPPQWGATAVLGANDPVQQGMPVHQGMGQGPYGPPTQPPMGGHDQFGGPFGGQGAPPAPGGKGGRAGKPLVIGVCALVLVAVITVGMVMWPEGDKKAPPATPTGPVSGKGPTKRQNPAVEQAVQVNLLLNASSDTRRTLARSLAFTGKCQDLPKAVSGFQEVATRRQNQLRRTAGLKLDKLQQGERMRSYLRQSFQASLQVDQSLLSWAQRNQRRCKGKPRPDAAHAPGRAPAERRATLSKKRFVVLWNRVATKTGQPTRQWNGW